MQRVLSARWLPAAVFAFALLVRILYLLQARDHPLHDFVFALVDSLYYHRQALAVARGDLLHDSPFFLAPLYPYLMGILYAQFGPSPDVVRGFQALLGAASCALLFAIGERLFDRRVALLAGLLLAVYPLHLYYTDLLLPTVLVLFLDLLLLYCLLGEVRAPSLRGAATCGLLLGLATLAKSNALLLLPAFGGVWLWLQRGQPARMRALWCGVFTAAALASLAPATLHNWLVSGRFVLVTTSTGRNLWKGNGPIANGTHPLGHPDPAELGMGSQLAGAADPVELVEQSRDYVRRTLDHVREHPAASLRLLGRKIVLFFNAVELGVRDQFYFARDHASLLRLPISLAWVMPLGLAGAVAAWSLGRPVLFLHALLAVQVISFVGVFVLARYRMVAAACLVLFASALAVAWLDAARAGRWRRIGPSALLAALLAVPVNWPLAAFPPHRGYALVYDKIGDMRHAAGREGEAIGAYEQALVEDWQGLDPLVMSAETRLKIARGQESLGRADDAAGTLRALLDATPVTNERSARVVEQAARELARLEGSSRGAQRAPDASSSR